MYISKGDSARKREMIALLIPHINQKDNTFAILETEFCRRFRETVAKLFRFISLLKTKRFILLFLAWQKFSVARLIYATCGVEARLGVARRAAEEVCACIFSLLKLLVLCGTTPLINWSLTSFASVVGRNSPHSTRASHIHYGFW